MAPVDLNLDDFQPAQRTLQFRGIVYNLPAVVPGPDVLRVVQLREELAAVGEESDDQVIALMNKAAIEMYDTVVNLLIDANPEKQILGGYSKDQRHAFSEATGCDPADEAMRAAGVQEEPSIRLSLRDCNLIWGYIMTGTAGIDIEAAVSEAVSGEAGTPHEPGEELGVADPPTVPQTLPVPKSRSRSRRSSPARSSK